MYMIQEEGGILGLVIEGKGDQQQEEPGCVKDQCTSVVSDT